MFAPRSANARNTAENCTIIPCHQRVFPAEIREAEPIRIRTIFLAQRREEQGD